MIMQKDLAKSANTDAALRARSENNAQRSADAAWARREAHRIKLADERTLRLRREEGITSTEWPIVCELYTSLGDLASHRTLAGHAALNARALAVDPSGRLLRFATREARERKAIDSTFTDWWNDVHLGHVTADDMPDEVA